MVKNHDKEDKVIMKLNNKYELIGYVLRYRSKELLAILVILLAGLLIWFYFSGVTPVDVNIKNVIPKQNKKEEVK